MFLKKGYTGKQVQEAHLVMAKRAKDYTKLNLPEQRGSISIEDVLTEPVGIKRTEMIKRWRASVWQVYSNSHKQIVLRTNALLTEY